jgi:hypothetical protein
MTTGPGNIRIDNSKNIRKSVPFGRNREKQKAARNETTTAMLTEATDRTIEFPIWSSSDWR